MPPSGAHDPNHLNLGIRFGGTPPDDVIALARGFDVYSMNKYRWAPPKDFIDRVYAIQKLPILIGEFHFGVPERGLAPGLVQAMNQVERGVAYSYYVEHAAEHPADRRHALVPVDRPARDRPARRRELQHRLDRRHRPAVPRAGGGRESDARQARRHPFGKARGDHAQAEGVGVRNARRLDLPGDPGDSVAVLAPMDGTPLSLMLELSQSVNKARADRATGANHGELRSSGVQVPAGRPARQ